MAGSWDTAFCPAGLHPVYACWDLTDLSEQGDRLATLAWGDPVRVLDVQGDRTFEALPVRDVKLVPELTEQETSIRSRGRAGWSTARWPPGSSTGWLTCAPTAS